MQPSQRVKVCVGDLLVGVLVQLRVGQIAVELFWAHVHSLAQARVLHLHEVVQHPQSGLKLDQVVVCEVPAGAGRLTKFEVRMSNALFLFDNGWNLFT